MQAGLLTDKIIFLEPTDSQDWSGAVTKSWAVTLTTRCARRKINTSGMSVNAMEEFIAGTILVQVRNNILINDKQRFDYGNYRYRITLIDKQKDNTLLITGVRLNNDER